MAAEYEMSFAEVVRRGVEQVVKLHPAGRRPAEGWKLPPAAGMGEALLPEAEWDLAHRDET